MQEPHVSGAPNLLYPLSAMPSDIGDRIKAARLAAPYSQDALAYLTGLRRQTIMHIEAGRARPSARSVFLIEGALGLASPYFVPSWEQPDMDAALPGPRVRQRRLDLNLSMAELAAAAGVVESTISRFERGVVSCRSIAEEGVDASGKPTTTIVSEGMAHALRFEDLASLNAYCTTTTGP